MPALLFLLSVFLWGCFLCKNFFKNEKLNSSITFATGSLVSLTIVFIFLFVTGSLAASILIYSVLSLLILHQLFGSLKESIGKYSFQIKDLILPALTLTLYMLFLRSFSFDASGNNFLIASNLYQDFGAHIANIRYFSQGSNYIPEVPFFAGSGLLYHFMFDFYAAVLEYLGMRIDIAYNLISAISLSLLLKVIFDFSNKLFRSTGVGILSCIFFVFAGDFSIIHLVQKYGLNLFALYHTNSYVQGRMGEYLIEKNFLTINTYLNQRHLVFGLLVFMVILYLIFHAKDKIKPIFAALVIGLLPFWNTPVLIALYIVLFASAILFKEKRSNTIKIIFLSLIFTIPQLAVIKLNSLNEIVFNPGFMVSQNLSFLSFSSFWIWTLGVSIPVAIFTLAIANSYQRKIFIVFFSIFLAANLFQFSRDMFDNHKLFNAWIIGVNMFCAYGVYFLFKKRNLFKAAAAFIFLALTASGISHMLVVKNDVYAGVPDYKQTQLGKFVNSKFKNGDRILTNGDIYDPVSITGIPIYIGRSHYIYLYGGDASDRIKKRDAILSGKGEDDPGFDFFVLYKEGKAPNAIKANVEYFDSNYINIYEDDIARIFKK